MSAVDNQDLDGPPKRPPRRGKSSKNVDWTPAPVERPVAVVAERVEVPDDDYTAPPVSLGARAPEPIAPEPPVLVDMPDDDDPPFFDDNPPVRVRNEPDGGHAFLPGTPPPVMPSRANFRDRQNAVEQSIADTMAALGVDPADITVSLDRKRPQFDEDGNDIYGHTATYEYAPTNEEIKARYGGGSYRALVYAPHPQTGKKTLMKNLAVNIAGPPKNPDAKKAKDRVAERSAQDSSTEVARMVVDSKEKEMDRLHADLAESRKQIAVLAAKSNVAPAADGTKDLIAVVIPSVMQLITASIEAADRRAAADREAAERRATVERESSRQAHEAQMVVFRALMEKRDPPPRDDGIVKLVEKMDAATQASTSMLLKVVTDSANNMLTIMQSSRETERALLTKQTNAQKDDFSTTLDNMMKMKQLNKLMDPPEVTPSSFVEAVRVVSDAAPNFITAFLGGRNANAAAKPAAPAAGGIKPGSVARVKVPVPAKPRALPAARKPAAPVASVPAAPAQEAAPVEAVENTPAPVMEVPTITMPVPAVPSWTPEPVPDTTDSATLIRHFIAAVEGALAVDWDEDQAFAGIVKHYPADILAGLKDANPEMALATLLSLAAEDSTLATPRGKRFLNGLADRLQAEG